MFIGNTQAPVSSTLHQLYDRFKDEDGYLYIVFTNMEDKG